MRVTLICDASYCHEYKVAGYGYWIACERGKKGGDGVVLIDVNSSGIAEMMAAANTIWCGLKEGLIVNGDELLLQTDCLQAIDTLKGTKLPANDQEQSVLSYFDQTILRHNLKVEFRHVRGHTVIQQARYAANRMCDKRAKSAMRKARMVKMKEQMKEFIS